MTDARDTSRVLTLVFTDLADSTALKTQRGDVAVGDLISRHREHVTRIANGQTILTTSGNGSARLWRSVDSTAFGDPLQTDQAFEEQLRELRTRLR